MSFSPSYRNAFIASLSLHLILLMMLVWESNTSHPALTATKEPNAHISSQASSTPVEPIKAVSVDSKLVNEAVQRLKNERLQQQKAEENRQKALAREAMLMKQKRVMEQQRIEQLKREAARALDAHKKQLAEEQKRLQALAKEKQEEETKLATMKKEQEKLKQQKLAESEKLAKLKKAHDEASAKAEKVNAEKAKLAESLKAKAEKAAMDAERNAQMAGEVDKYKALIISAISRQWILPEHVDASLSSQFRIRLAPNGMVLEVSLTRSSGDVILDRSAQQAIYKASPLPVPSDPHVFDVFRDISLTVRPESARG